MLVVFSHIFVADTKITFDFNFVAPLTAYLFKVLEYLQKYKMHCIVRLSI